MKKSPLVVASNDTGLHAVQEPGLSLIKFMFPSITPQREKKGEILSNSTYYRR